MNDNKLVLSAAITGVITSRIDCPYIPYTPEEMGEEAKRAVDAGASIIHIHARERDGSPSMRLEVYQEIHEEVRKRCPDVLLNYTTSAIGIPDEERVPHIEALKPDIAGFNVGSMNFAVYSENDKQFFWNDIFANSFDTMQHCINAMNAAGTTPEMECFDIGHIHNIEPLREMGLIPSSAYYSLVLGVLGGAPATPDNLIHLSKQLPKDAFWQSVCIGREQWKLSAVACAYGGHFRVGFEDNYYLPNGEMAKSNGECVDWGVRLANSMGRDVASIAEAREILNIPFRA